jgi:hypothetical protein
MLQAQRLRPNLPDLTLEPAQLLCSDAIRKTLRQIETDYARMASQLSGLPDERLAERLKAYDNYNRFTFGRARTAKLSGREFRRGLTPRNFQAIREGDTSPFPEEMSEWSYSGVWQAVRWSAEVLSEDVPADERALLSVYCHRVVIRPGAVYPGFRHRDTTKVQERCGTCAWYPRIDAEKMEGVALFCKLNEPGLTEKQLRSQEPDFCFPMEEYRQRMLLMRYPHNLFHGVEPGQNRTPKEEGRKPSVRDFFAPHPNDFVKDLVIITMSEEINAED